LLQDIIILVYRNLPFFNILVFKYQIAVLIKLDLIAKFHFVKFVCNFGGFKLLFVTLGLF